MHFAYFLGTGRTLYSDCSISIPVVPVRTPKSSNISAPKPLQQVCIPKQRFLHYGQSPHGKLTGNTKNDHIKSYSKQKQTSQDSHIRVQLAGKICQRAYRKSSSAINGCRRL